MSFSLIFNWLSFDGQHKNLKSDLLILKWTRQNMSKVRCTNRLCVLHPKQHGKAKNKGRNSDSSCNSSENIFLCVNQPEQNMRHG